MEDDQQFCLRWNNHQTTLIQNFDTLLESGTLVDCTLAAEGKYLKAHKVVLSACSPYFEGLLSEHYDKHPVFILKDVKFKELKAMMDYMYRGEVNISQDQLAALLKAAESLQIKGLSESKTGSSGSTSSSKAETRSQKTVQPSAPSLDIPHSSSGLTIEKNNKVPRQSLAQASVGDLPEDSASPSLSKGISSREGSVSPNGRKRKRYRRRSLNDDNPIDNHETSNSSDMSHQPMNVPALGVAPVADEKSMSDPSDSLGRSALMQQLTKPADDMLPMPVEKPEPNDTLIEPKSEYLDEAEDSVEDLTLDDEGMDDTMDDGNRAGPSHDPSHPGLGSWHVTGDRSNAGGVVGSVVAGAPGSNDEVFMQAQEAAQAHRDSQAPKQRKLRVLANKVLVPRLPVRRRVPSTKVIENLELAKEKIIEATKKKSQEQREGSNRRKQVLTVRDDRFPCTNPGCGKTFKNQSDCNFHIKNRCNKPPRYKCVYCQYKTFHSSNVKRHISQSHKGKEVGVIELYNPRADARVHVCTTPGCPKKYKYRCNLTTHLKNECGKPPRFKCFYCDFKNSYKHIIKKHSERKHFHEVFRFETLDI
ncbi:uncharacterized protein LOC141536125 isoform X7 [Cotesia typhae]|uniref:uncharacterized protein LOC141536125 isoform X7 n=1 Tax=Cotesia typhae TaxID=2053667 RepID=UPI003D6939D2